jgi:leucine dehydrogenase
MNPKQYHKLAAYKKHRLILDLSKHSSLKGFIAIHNDILGPALGGTRIANYSNSKQALIDALRLSEAMTYKCAVAGLPFGGGKGVIINQPGISKSELLRQYAEVVNKLKGRFHTGEDVGLEEKDVQEMLKISPYFIGKTGQAGDPSYYAALSAFNSIKVALFHVFGSQKIQGRTFAVKGVGKTGRALVEFLASQGGKIYITDPDKKKVEYLTKKYKNVLQSKSEISELNVDVFCPCALGNDLTKKNVNSIKAKIIVGTANNQLESLEVGDILFKKGVLHIPDYLANAGGLVNVADELLSGGYNKKRVLKSINGLKQTLLRVLRISRKNNLSPIRVANNWVESNFFKNKQLIKVAA